MKKQFRTWTARFSTVFLGAIIGSSAAHGQDVKTRYMPGTEFSKYRTYCWVRIEGGGYPDQIIDTDIMRSIDSQMAAKGLTKLDCGTADSSAPKADLLIAYHVAIRQETQWNAFGSSFDRCGGLGWGAGAATATSSTIDIGTLVLNMYDQGAKQLVWAGTATKTISLSKKQEKNQKNLDKATQSC